MIADYETHNALSMDDLAKALERRPPTRVEGTAVFLTANPDNVPGALLHNLKHNRVLHRRNLITTIKTVSVPHVAPEERREMTRINDDFSRVTLRYGFMDQPDVPVDLGLEKSRPDVDGIPTTPTFFIGRNSLRASAEEGLPFWQDQILIFLQRNASDPTDFFKIPPNRVVELGIQVVV